MLRRHRHHEGTMAKEGRFDELHQWVLSLPWVVERPYSVGTPGVRSFGVDCEPLGRRRLWLLTGLQLQMERDALGLAVVVPTEAARKIEALGWGRCVAPLPDDQQVVAVAGEARRRRRDIEALVWAAYGCAML